MAGSSTHAALGSQSACAGALLSVLQRGQSRLLMWHVQLQAGEKTLVAYVDRIR